MIETVYSEDHQFQKGSRELKDGVFQEPFEHPGRAEGVLERVREVSAILPAREFGLEPVARIHDRAYLDFLRTAHEKWRAEHGDGDALPLIWPNRGLRQKPPAAIDGLLGYYSFDAGTPITSGTWRAIRAAANVCLSAAERLMDKDHTLFALCRPPGHHADKDLFGGYCFLNNAAIAAQFLRDRGAARVAVLDVDYHHGNGTQAIFYERADVLFLSLHGDPKHSYPYFLGYADERGSGAGEGYNLNLPLPRGTDWKGYAAALKTAQATVTAFQPDYLVVSLGMDTFAGDPLSQFKLVSADYLEMGAAIAACGTPTLFVLEGGYAVAELGDNVANALLGFDRARFPRL